MAKNDGNKKGMTLTLNCSHCVEKLEYIRKQKELSGDTYIAFIYKSVRFYVANKKAAD